MQIDVEQATIALMSATPILAFGNEDVNAATKDEFVEFMSEMRPLLTAVSKEVTKDEAEAFPVVE